MTTKHNKKYFFFYYKNSAGSFIIIIYDYMTGVLEKLLNWYILLLTYEHLIFKKYDFIRLTYKKKLHSPCIHFFDKVTMTSGLKMN